jgi:hypothetical protein
MGRKNDQLLFDWKPSFESEFSELQSFLGRKSLAFKKNLRSIHRLRVWSVETLEVGLKFDDCSCIKEYFETLKADPHDFWNCSKHIWILITVQACQTYSSLFSFCNTKLISVWFIEFQADLLAIFSDESSPL